jgi:hypothetical protein
MELPMKITLILLSLLLTSVAANSFKPKPHPLQSPNQSLKKVADGPEVSPIQTDPPFRSEVASVSLTVVEDGKGVLLNLSGKSIDSIFCRVSDTGGFISINFLVQSNLGKGLREFGPLKPNEEYTTSLITPMFVMTAVVFSDGTVEGLPNDVKMARSYMLSWRRRLDAYDRLLKESESRGDTESAVYCSIRTKLQHQMEDDDSIGGYEFEEFFRGIFTNSKLTPEDAVNRAKQLIAAAKGGMN